MKPIHSTEDHAAALGRIATLWDVSNDSPEADELEVLSVLVSEYEREHFPVNPDGGYKLPDVFTFYLETCGRPRTELVSMVGGAQNLAALMAGQSDLTLDQVRAIHKAWQVPIKMLVRPLP